MSFLSRIFNGSPSQAEDPQALATRLGAPSPDQPHDLVLYGYSTCPYCQRVFRALDELSLTVPRRDPNRDAEARRSLVEATGRTQVPCLFIDDVPLLESADIVAWLRAYSVHGQAGSAPA